jgi:uncharacterized OB-fold protein
MSESARIKGYACPNCKWSDVRETEICPRCHAPVNETMFPARGTIANFTVIRYPPPGFESLAPYVVALVDIENGPRVMARVAADPNDVQVGQIVEFNGTVGGALEFKRARVQIPKVP